MRTQPPQDMGVLVHHLLGKLQQACQHRNIFCWPVLAHYAEKSGRVVAPEKCCYPLPVPGAPVQKKRLGPPTTIHCLLTNKCDLHAFTRIKGWARHGSNGISPDMLATDSDSVDIIQIMMNGAVKMFL